MDYLYLLDFRQELTSSDRIINGESRILGKNSLLVLLDNGSLNPDATLGLRRIAKDLSVLIGLDVQPVSTRYADRIGLDRLGGLPARVWRSFLFESLERGCREFIVLPLFFGESDALVRYIPQVVSEARELFGEFHMEFARPLVDLMDTEDDGVAKLLVDDFGKRVSCEKSGELPTVLVVDHGSPNPSIADCRSLVAKQMATLLEGRVADVVACSMERREGEQYDFNEPMLSATLDRFVRATGDRSALYLCHLFLFPGRHAGVDGDIEKICRDSGIATTGRKFERCSLVGDSKLLPSLLEQRFEQVKRALL